MDQPLLAYECYAVSWTLSSTTSGHQYTPDFPLTLYTADLAENGRKSLMIFRHRDTRNLSFMAFSLSRAHLPVDGRSDVLDRSVVLKNEAQTFLPGPFTMTDFLLAFRECALAGSKTVETERIDGHQRLPKPEVEGQDGAHSVPKPPF